MTTVGVGPAASAASITRRWPRWTPSKVPSATARGFRSSSETVRATFMPASPPARRRPALPSHNVRMSGWARRRPVRIAAASSVSTSTAGRNGRTSAGGTSRSSSAASTENGPTSSRRRVAAVPAEGVGDRADVCAGADPEIEACDPVCVLQQLERRDDVSAAPASRPPARAGAACRRARRRLLTADAAGTTSSTSPRRLSNRSSSSARPGGADSSTTSPSRSPVDVRAVRSTSVR